MLMPPLVVSIFIPGQHRSLHRQHISAETFGLNFPGGWPREKMAKLAKNLLPAPKCQRLNFAPDRPLNFHDNFLGFWRF